ncbi:hypothetical protein HanIR_Chr02g0051891 [Helianthus annuus]|nr:hypothetical protein HanIR_Chr02g0051891 [Helianthus annuus]
MSLLVPCVSLSWLAGDFFLFSSLPFSIKFEAFAFASSSTFSKKPKIKYINLYVSG